MRLKKITLDGYEILDRTVATQGSSGRVYLPISWVGCEVSIIRTTEPAKVKE